MPPSFSKLLTIGVTLAVLGLGLPQVPVALGGPVCRGSDMLEEWSTSEPQATADIRAAAKATPNTEALLWKVARAGKPDSYLFGTIHLTDERLTTLSPQFHDIIAKSKTVAMEVADLSDSATAAVMAKSVDLIIYTDGRKLSDQLTSDEFRKVESVVGKSGMPGELASTIRPWMVTMLLAVPECERQRAQAGGRVLDAVIAELAKAKGVAVIGLERMEDQVLALAQISESQQVDMLKAGLKFEHRTQDLTETLIQLYLKRDMGAAMPFQLEIAKKAGISGSAFSDFQRDLLDKRNAKMKDGAIPLIEAGPTLVAVGALHLSGKTGLVSLLRDAGYTVTPAE